MHPLSLQGLLAPFGNVLHAVVIMDMNTMQSRGFGFVHMDNAQAAAAAVDGLHGKPMEGRPLTVRLRSQSQASRGGADPRGPPPPRSGVRLFAMRTAVGLLVQAAFGALRMILVS